MIRLLKHTTILLVLLFVQLDNVKSEEALYPEATIFTQKDDYIQHTVQKGETLFSLSRRYNVKLDDILAANPGLSVKTFFAGRKIRIPGDNATTTSQDQENEKVQQKEPEKGMKVPEVKEPRKTIELKKITKDSIPQLSLVEKSEETKTASTPPPDVSTTSTPPPDVTTTSTPPPAVVTTTPTREVTPIDNFRENQKLNIIRFDVDLYRYLNKQLSEEALSTSYRDFLEIYGQQVVGTGKPNSMDFYRRFNDFFSEPTLMLLYEEEQLQFNNLDFINKELDPALNTLFKEFPRLKRPSVYAHISGLNQNVVVTDDILSISLDKYMGADYPLYKNHFHNYQLRDMAPERIVPDYLLGFLMANFPFQGRNDILLERIIYEGKLRYILTHLLPNRTHRECMGYTEEQDSWCNTNRSRIWKAILRNGHLYTPDYITTAKYINSTPYTAPISTESPGKLGVWVGFQIVDSYMKNYPETTLSELMNLADPMRLLKDSKYKP
ncbi:MAG: LysM peptidoglycan-binding domain-containing protein [Dysgonamonadaceae bacterium]|nr:LysM peptidoglycan-binding domain-containing protein [Dysgonamonadaceae bacterium]